MRARAGLASDVSARVEALIGRRHGGDRRAAARHLGIEPERLAGLLSGDWRRFSLDALAALVRGYGVRVEWLLASTSGPDAGRPRRAARPALEHRPVDVPRPRIVWNEA